MWQDMGPFMALAMVDEENGARTVALCVLQGRPRVLTTRLFWHIPGRDFRKDWHRMDEGETS